MKKFFYVWSLLALLASVNVVAQQHIFRTQGHPREDIMSKYNMVEKMQAPVALAGNYDPDFEMEDIEFWVGDPDGTHKAAVVIDWYLGESITYVWGYKWTKDEDGYGIKMLEAIAKEDPRFYILLYQATQYGSALGGMGYDVNGTGNTCLLLDNNKICANELGIIDTQVYNFDSYTPSDATSYWRSGWYDGYWSYQVRDTSTSDFQYSDLGASSRKLVDGSWDGWGYQEGWDSWFGMLPRSPYVAAPRP